MSDLLHFAEPIASQAELSVDKWRVLIVDDEPAIHQVTKLALNRLVLENRHIEFLDAFSAQEAKVILQNESDIAMIFLDVIMETDTAGLDLVHWIRDELKNNLIRIVLRTGQPGAAPEERVILEYDINDYKEKTELVRSKLFSTTCAALRNYRELYRLEQARHHEQITREGLEKVVLACANLFESSSLYDFATGLLQQVASLLHLHEDGMFLKASAFSALKDNAEFTILAKTGRFEAMDQGLPEDVHRYVALACDAGKSIHIDERFIGYYPSKHGQIDIIYFEGVDRFERVDERLLELFGTNISAALERFLSFQRYKESQARLVLQLAQSIEKREGIILDHSQKMTQLCIYIGGHYGLSRSELELLELLAPLHDIGLLSIPQEVLNKPGPLSEEERALIQAHTEAGRKIFESEENDVLSSAARIAFEHHERFDGTGYPQGLQGHQSYILGKIVGIADTFIALTTQRTYRQAWTVDQALEYLREERGKQFDPVLVDIFTDNAHYIKDLLAKSTL